MKLLNTVNTNKYSDLIQKQYFNVHEGNIKTFDEDQLRVIVGII